MKTTRYRLRIRLAGHDRCVPPDWFDVSGDDYATLKDAKTALRNCQGRYQTELWIEKVTTIIERV